METIRMYLDNMFSGLPKTAQMSEIKNNILSNMEDKYNELKAAGKSENEAIGIVISEFGNIDELINELGIRKEEAGENRRVITREETDAYLSVKRTMGVQISFGVLLCILAPASFLLLNKLFRDGLIWSSLPERAGTMLGLIPLFLLVTVAVAVFIYSGMKFEKFQYIEDGVDLPASVEADIQRKYDAYNRQFYFNIILGTCLLIISPISLFVVSFMENGSSTYGVVILLCIVAIAVPIFIYTGSIRESYCRLLKIGDYSEKKTFENKVIGAVASIVWPLAVIIFLISGFAYQLWSKAWIVFPITGLLFGMFSGAYSIITGNKGQK